MFSFKATRVVLDLCATFCRKTSQFSATRGASRPYFNRSQINNLATRIQRHAAICGPGAKVTSVDDNKGIKGGNAQAVRGVCDTLLCKEEKKPNTQVNEWQQQDGERPEAPAAAPAAAPLVANPPRRRTARPRFCLAPDGWSLFILQHLGGRAKEKKPRRRRRRRGWGRGRKKTSAVTRGNELLSRCVSC